VTVTDDLIREIQDIARRMDILETSETLRNEAYGKLYTADGVASMVGVTTTPVKFTLWASEGQSQGVTLSASNDSITVQTPGDYLVLVQTSFSGSNNSNWEMHLRIDAVEKEEGWHRKLSSSGDEGSASFVGIAPCPNGNEELTCYINSDSATIGYTFTLSDGQFIAWKIQDQ
jgi:hypothetical protein